MKLSVRPLRTLLGLVAAALVTTGAFALGSELSSENVRETSVSHGTSIIGLRPTGVGLPLVGAHGTIGAGEYASALREYHDSGQYRHDLEAVGRRAEAYVVRRTTKVRRAARARCRRARDRELDPEVVAKRCRKPRLAIVFDIDETALSNYDELAATGFAQAVAALLLSAAQGNAPAIEPTHEVYETALAKRLSVFFITGRPESIPMAREVTARNLDEAGYDQYERLILNDTGKETIPYKSGKRAEIERQGFDIIANLGDQESDLAGGHADRAFKLPNPFYFIS